MGYDMNVAIDLEFTPIFGREAPGGLAEEVIEVGAVKLAADGTETDFFSAFVKPQYAMGVTRQVRRLTGIRSEDLAHAPSFSSVLSDLMDWMGEGSVRIITWDTYDKRQVVRECAAKGIEVDLPSRWMDLQALYPRLMGTKRRKFSLGEAADWCGIEFDLRHRALADARATGQIFRMAKRGECYEQRLLLEREVRHSPHDVSFAASVADRCHGLEELYQALARQEAA